MHRCEYAVYGTQYNDASRGKVLSGILSIMVDLDGIIQTTKLKVKYTNDQCYFFEEARILRFHTLLYSLYCLQVLHVQLHYSTAVDAMHIH